MMAGLLDFWQQYQLGRAAGPAGQSVAPDAFAPSYSDPAVEMAAQYPGLLQAAQPNISAGYMDPASGGAGLAPPQAPQQVGLLDIPLPPRRPANLNASADMPAVNARPAMATAAPTNITPPATQGQPGAQPPQAEGPPSFFNKFMGGLERNSDQLLHIGAGLLSTRNFGEGLARGLQGANAATASQSRSALDQVKALREMQSLKGGAEFLQKKFGLDPAQAAALASNPSVMTSLAGEALKEDKPQLIDIPDGQGGTRKAWVKPGGTAPVYVDQPQAPAANPNGEPVPVPPVGVDPAKWREEQAKLAVKKQGEQQDRGRMAETVLPHLQRAYESYKALAGEGGVGPIVSSGPSRFMGSVVGTNAEKLRQEYEASKATLEMMQAQLLAKGQGTITDFERKILTMTLPRLDAADPATGLKTLEGMYQQFRSEHSAANQRKPSATQPEYGPLQRGGNTLPQGVTVRRIN